MRGHEYTLRERTLRLPIEKSTSKLHKAPVHIRIIMHVHVVINNSEVWQWAFISN